MLGPLPFSGFLQLLRGHGIPIGLREYQNLAQLLEKWSETDRDYFRLALASLLGRDAAEVALIKALFDEEYPPDLPADSTAELPALLRGAHRPRQRMIQGALTLCLALLAMIIGWRIFFTAPPPPRSDDQSGAAGESNVMGMAKTPLPGLPAPPQRHDFGPPILWSLGLGFVAALGIYFVRWREMRAGRAERYLREALDSLPGPHKFQLTLADLRPFYNREDIEEVATVLGRIPSVGYKGDALDIDRTIQKTIEAGTLPTLVYQERVNDRLLLILQDTSFEMAALAERVDAFVNGITQRGIPLERWYFDGDASQLSLRPQGPPTSFEIMTRQRSGAPLLIISTGSGVLDGVSGRARWLSLLKHFSARAWLNPVEDAALQRPELYDLPIEVWPMTSAGLLAAAQRLVQEGHAPSRVAMKAPGLPEIFDADVEKLKQVVVLAPFANRQLAELLRQRFFPELHPDTVLRLQANAEAPEGRELSFSSAEVTHCLSALRQQNAGLEGAVRRYLLKVLFDSQPPYGSVAHMRWRLACAMQEVYLEDAEKRSAKNALATLDELASGLLGEEVARALSELGIPEPARPQKRPIPLLTASLPANLQRDAERLAASRATNHLSAAELKHVAIEDAGLRGLVLPNSQEALAGLLAALLLFCGLWLSRHIPVERIEHELDAYKVSWVPRRLMQQYDACAGMLAKETDSPGGLLLQRKSSKLGPRTQAQLYKDAEPSELPPLVVDETLCLPLKKYQLGHWYSLRTPLPEGNLAVSNFEWVPRVPQAVNEITIMLHSRPNGANVLGPKADGSIGILGMTPFKISVPRFSAAVSLRLILEGYEEYRKQFQTDESRFFIAELKPGKTAKIAEMASSHGSIRVACSKCHGDLSVSTQPKNPLDFNHNIDVSSFPLSARHVGIPCASCHPNSLFRLIGFTGDCITCHKNVHGESLFGRMQCAGCHSAQTDWRMIGFDHKNRTRFDIEGPHKKPCAVCHPPKTATAPNPECGACHKDVHNRRFATVGACANCHLRTTFGPELRFDHARQTKFRLTARHEIIDCRACHRGKGPADFEKFDDIVSVEGKGASRKIRIDCMSCHTHENAHKKQFTSDQCLKCHLNPGDSRQVENREDLFSRAKIGHGPAKPFQLTDGHKTSNCQKCHKNENYQDTPINCIACHEDRLHKRALGKDTCLNCHEGARWSATKFDHDKSDFRLTGAHADTPCESCHPLRHYKPTPTKCYQCHSEAVHVHRNRVSGDCAPCHDSKTWGLPKT